MREMNEEEMRNLTEIFVMVLKQQPQNVVARLNKHLETVGFELVIKTVDVQKKYADKRVQEERPSQQYD